MHRLERNLVPDCSRTSDRVGIFGILALHEVNVVNIHPVTGHGEAEDMLARREGHVFLDLVVVIVVFFAGTCLRHGDFFGNVVTVDRKLEA